MLNSKRILAELVSLDAWFEAYKSGSDIPLQVAASFSDGRFGGDEGAAVKFKANLKKAVLQIRLSEEFHIVRSSRLISGPAKNTKFTETSQGKTSQELRNHLETTNAATIGITNTQVSQSVSDQSSEYRLREASSTFSKQQDVHHDIQVYHRNRDGIEEWVCDPVI